MSTKNIEKALIGVVTLILVSLLWAIYGFTVNDLINVGVMGILCVGFTFTYMMEGFPNFAHTSFALFGAITTFYLTRFLRFNPYDTWPFSILVGGAVNVLLYILLVNRIKKRGGDQSITLTFTFLVVSTIIGSLSYIFNYWVSLVSYSVQEYNLRWMDFRLYGSPGIVYVGIGTLLLLSIYLYLFLTRTRTGISLKALAENEILAEIMGINSFRAHCLTWFISGGLAALAGSIIVIHQGISPPEADVMIISVMTGAIFGGLDSIFGAIVGGVFVALAEKILAKTLYWFLGLSVLTWAPIYPLTFLVITLLFFPNGVLYKRRVDSVIFKSIRKWMKVLRKKMTARAQEGRLP